MASGAQQASRVFTVVPAGAIAKGRGVTRGRVQATAGTSSAGDPIIGIADHAVASGDRALRVVVGETALAEAGAAIDGTVLTLKTDANGRFIATTAGTDIVAAILANGDTATAAGQFVEVIPVQNPVR